jgi:NitT/TauT family transport system ATP-binding protein
MPHIEVRNVSLTYDTPAGRVAGVEGASFDIGQSEFLCLVGPSGCGKTTLLNMIAGFLKPTGGEIRIGGKPITGHGMDRGVVFQDFAQLFPWRTALGNVTFGLEMKGMAKAKREPFAALDALTRDAMQQLLAEVWRETRKTVIYVTHNVAEAVYLADRVIVMSPHPGTVKTEVAIPLARPRNPLSVEFLDYQKLLLRHLGQETSQETSQQQKTPAA